MEDDAAAETTSIDFSLAPSNGSGDVAGGSPTESPPSDDNEIMRAGRGAVHHPMPAIQVPKPTRPQPPTSPAPFGDEAADGGAPLPVASPASAHVAKPITPFQAIRPAGLRRKGHLVRPSLKRDASLDFVRAVQQLDSEDFQRSRSRSSDSEGLDDDSDHSGNGASAKRRCRQGAAGDAINEGERTTQAWAQSPSPTAPSRQLLAEKNDGADDTMAAPVVAAAPASRTSAVEQAALPLPQEQHQRPGTALTPSTKARATAHESPPPLSSTTTGTAPSKDISGPKPQTPTSPPAQQPRNEQRRSSPSWSRHTSPGYTVSAATAATTTGAADIVGATLPTASPASPGRIALPDAGPQHHTPHLRLLSSSMQNEDDPMYCTVSEMTMANPVTPRGGVSLPLLGLSTGLQQARGASGGSLYLSPARPSLRPAAASRRVQSSDFSLDESNALLTLNTPREVVKSATAAPKESTYFRDAAFEDGAELASTSTPSQSMLGLHGKPLPSFLQHPSAPPAIIAELKRHAEREKEDEKEHTLRPTSTPSPRETRVGGGGAHREHRSASSIFKSFPSKTICGHSRSSVAAKSGVDKHGEGGGEGRDVKTSGRSTSSIQSTRSSSLASGLSRLSSMFKRLVSGAGHGSVDVKTQRPLQPSSSSSQQQRRTRQHEDNAATTTAVAASLQMSTLGNTVKTTDSSTNPRSADTLVGCKQRQPPPAVTPAAASATAVKPGRATPKREITSSWHGDSINFPTDEEEDRGRGDGVAGVAPLIPPAAAAPAVPVEGASGGAEESQGRRKRKDAERPDRRRRRRPAGACHNGAAVNVATPTIAALPPVLRLWLAGKRARGTIGVRCVATANHRAPSDALARVRGITMPPTTTLTEATPTVPPAGTVTLRAKSRVTSSVNHFAVSWRTRPTTRHRQELLSHAGRASLARLPKRDAERKSGSAKAAVVAAEAVAASRRASGSQLWAGSRRSAVKSRQSGTAPFPPRLLTPGRLEQYEAALRRDIRELDVIRRAMATPALTAGPLPSRVGITTVATASTPAPKRRSSAGNTRAAHRCHGPIVSARLSHPNDYGSSKANEVESAAVDGRGGRDDSSPAPHTPRTATAPSQSASSSLFRIRTAAGVRGQPQQRPSASASYTSHTSKADSVLAAVRRPGATDSGNDDAEAAPHHSSSTQLPGDATCFAMMALQRRYEQLLEDLVAQSAPQPPATSEIDEGGNATDDEVSMKAHWRHNYSARRHQYPHQHLSREQVDATMEAEVARCAAALRAEYYQPPQRQQNQQQEPSTIMERASLPHATHEAGADTASVAHVAASYAQALRPSCAACRPQQLNEYMTLGLLSMMHRGADECVDTAAVAASENAANLRQAHARPVTAPTLVQRRIREDLYAAPRRCSRRRMTQAGGKQKAACSDGNTAAAPPITSLTHFFTPTPVVIDGALLTRLMRRERHARRERVSKEQEARHTLQRLYIVETILVLRAMGKAAATQEQEAPAAPALPTSQTLGGAATAPVNDRGGKRSGSRSPLAATRSSRDASVEDDGGATREPVVATVSVSQQPREEASASEEEHAAAAAVVVCGDAAAASAPLPMGDTTARPLAGDASEMRNEVEVATGERDADDSSSSSASPAVLVTPSPQAAAATEVGGEVKHAKDHGGDVDLAESSSSNRSASSVLSFHVEDSQEGAALQHPGPGADGADKGHYPVVASGSSAAAIPAAAAQLSSDESTSSVTAAVDDLAIPPTASPQAAQARPLSIDRGEPITDSDRHGTLDDIDGAAGTVDYAPDGHAAASPPSAGKHTNAASHRYPPPVPSSCSAASAAPSSPSRNLHVVEVVEAARAAVLVPEGEGAVDASHSTGDAGSTGVEVVARDALQSSVTPVEATASTALASAAAAEAIPESEPPASAEDDPRRALEGPQPWKREQRQQQKMATVTTCTAVPASPRRVRFSLQPEVVSGDDGEVKEFSDASKQTCWEGRETSHAAGGPQTMTPEPFKRAAVDKDGLAIDLLEKLNGLDALLLYSFPTYFTTGTDEDGLPGVVMRPHRHPPSASPSVQPRWWRSPLASTPFVSPRPLQPYRSAPSRHLSDSMSPLAEGRETPPSSAADAAAADASPFDAHASALRGHRTPPRLPPESLASQLRRKYGLPQPVQQRRHDHSAEFTLGLPATATPSVAAAAPTPPSASVSGSWPSAVPAAERPSLQEGIDTPHLAVRRSVWF
ncbi:hypothetical protein CGC21_9565 [Leishmania donovani]|uniref:Uncharacterized protein n=1 Tax=Leishmania donovani TaxID=5661 RepID=A0A504X4W8_LEIDO|nr:hypothetical protein CGC21_9565 [Leishmania donovani]